MGAATADGKRLSATDLTKNDLSVSDSFSNQHQTENLSYLRNSDHNKDNWFDQQAKANLKSVIHHRLQTRSKFEPWVRVNLLQSSKLKPDQTQRIQ